MEGFLSYFSVVPDPRALNAQHALTDILFIALAAMLCGAKTCTDMTLFGRAKEEALREILDLSHGIPSHDTFSGIFRRLDPEAFEASFRGFAAAFGKGLPPGVVAVDGKMLRRAYDRGKSHAPQVMVTAWASEMRMVLGSRSAPGGNETEAVMELLRTLDVKGAIVTADALHCHPAMAETVAACGADYVLCLKGNHGPLLKSARQLLADAVHPPFAETCERAHGRKETRRAVVVPAQGLDERHGFRGLKAIGRIESLRDDGSGLIETAVRHFVLSRIVTPAELLRIVRAHWTIENSLHWVLDVTLDEDLARSRRDNSAKNLASLRRLVMNVLRTETSKTSLAGKIKHAGWNNQYLFKLLAHMR
jgi:predicted transposase YbfD/YdcC